VSTILYIVASCAIIVITITVVSLSRCAMAEMRSIGRATEQLNEFVRKLNAEVVPVVRNATKAIEGIDKLVENVAKSTDRIEKISASIEGLLDTANMASAASKAAKTTAVELASVYEGLKRGIKSLRGL